MKSDEPDFDVAIEGSTIRLAHKGTGHIFEYLWFERPPHLRNAIVRPASACNVAPTHFAPVAERAALLQLNENSAARRLSRHLKSHLPIGVGVLRIALERHQSGKAARSGARWQTGSVAAASPVIANA